MNSIIQTEPIEIEYISVYMKHVRDINELRARKQYLKLRIPQYGLKDGYILFIHGKNLSFNE